ncbi:hypothetical protein E2C01_036020 [Portunus trituberculatus]|uniref:Uncharacterized protein n=1 Tax=Portunus trituberculatus TaxID=210409 RepID=A0A5B7FAV9_PORTR|nr:hypothetical protein [Portunus trituberculatus]
MDSLTTDEQLRYVVRQTPPTHDSHGLVLIMFCFNYDLYGTDFPRHGYNLGVSSVALCSLYSLRFMHLTETISTYTHMSSRTDTAHIFPGDANHFGQQRAAPSLTWRPASHRSLTGVNPSNQ